MVERMGKLERALTSMEYIQSAIPRVRAWSARHLPNVTYNLGGHQEGIFRREVSAEPSLNPMACKLMTSRHQLDLGGP
jgi:hypothetical protein